VDGVLEPRPCEVDRLFRLNDFVHDSM